MIKVNRKLFNTLLVVTGLVIGYSLSYFMLSQTVSMKTEEAYELGYEWGRAMTITEYKKQIDSLLLIQPK